MGIAPQTLLTFLIILVVFDSNESTQFGITVNSNGYEGVTLAISEKIDNSPALVQKIKDTITEASRVLFTATKYQLYFKNVTIVLPKTWEMEDGYKQISGSKFNKAHIRIDEEHPVTGKTPYVYGTPVCGQSGQYMHLTQYLIFAGKFAGFGEIGAVLIHEWGHLRWGLFDEYPAIEEASLNVQPSFSNIDNTWTPIRCTDQVSGQRVHNETGKPCSTLTQDGKPDANCIFLPDENAQATASLMGHQNVKTMAEFCDTDDPSTSPNVRHNSKLENNQNIRCGGRSAWEVMREHADFIGNSPGSANQDTTPHFTVEIESNQRICLSLDISGSMDRKNRLDKLYTATSNFLLYNVANGSFVGIVTFNTVGTIVNQLMTVSNQTIRERLVSSLPTSASGGTSIGAGIMTCITALNVSSGGLQGSIIYLVTDGAETTAPYIADVQPVVVDLGITVTTLALGDQADTNLGTISRASGGKSFFYSEEDNSTTLFDAFTSTAVVDGSSDLNIQIYSFSFQVSSSVDFQRSIIIDDTIGKDTLFQVITNDNVDISITVTSPDGTVHDEVSSNFGITTLKIADVALSGTYTVVVTTTSATTITPVLNIQSKPRSAATSVITANVWLSDDTHVYSSESRTAVYVAVTKGMAPIFKAEVDVNIESYGNTIVKQLLDNGIGSDIRENDGIYSGYIFSSAFHGDGRHSLKVDAHSLDNKAEMLVSTTKSDTFPYYSGLTTVPVGNFQRIVLSNEITVSNYTSEPLLDVIGPAKITSLSLKSVQETTGNKMTATLTWKAVGDDLDIGTATEYEIRMSGVFSTLKTNPEQTTRLTENIPVPSVAGTLEQIVIDFNDDSSTKYFSVRSIDETGNKGDFSNIVSVSRLTDQSWTQGVTTSDLTFLQITVSTSIAGLILVTAIVIVVIITKSVSSKKRPLLEKSDRNNTRKQRVRWSNKQSDHPEPWWHHAMGDHRTWLQHALYEHKPWWYHENNDHTTDKAHKKFKYHRHRQEHNPV